MPPEKQELMPLDYGGPQAPRRARFWLGIALILGPLLLTGLFELQRMPYRPPQDMSTLLGSSENAIVLTFMVIIGLLWAASAIWFFRLRRIR